MAKRVLDRRALRAKGVQFSNVHLLRLEAQDKFPRRIQLSENRVGWLEDEVDEWIDARAAARSSTPPTPPRNITERERARPADRRTNVAEPA